MSYLLNDLSSAAAAVITYVATRPEWVLVALGLLFLPWQGLRRRRWQPWRLRASKRWLKAFRSKRDQYSPAQRIAYVRKVDHFLFEDILMSCFEERGYSVRRTKMTRDGGIDGYVDLDGKRVVIQAKRYRGTVSKQHVESFASVVQAERYDLGLFIHTGKTSKPVLNAARCHPHIALISGASDILALLDGQAISIRGLGIRPCKP